MTAATVAEDFLDAWTGTDFARARSLLHNDLSFEGPIESLSDADSKIASVSAVLDARPFAAMFEGHQGQ